MQLSVQLLKQQLGVVSDPCGVFVAQLDKADESDSRSASALLLIGAVCSPAAIYIDRLQIHEVGSVRAFLSAAWSSPDSPEDDVNSRGSLLRS